MNCAVTQGASLDLARVLLAIGVGWVCLRVDGEVDGVDGVGVGGGESLEGLRLDWKKSVIFCCRCFVIGCRLAAVGVVRA